MRENNQSIKDKILLSVLPDIPFDGWTMAALERAAEAAGYSASMAASVFPAGERDAIIHFSRWADRKMIDCLNSLSDVPPRVRDKVALAVRTRLEILGPYKEAERLAIAYWVRPFRKWEGAKLVWKTADSIWNWAGDTATDYNRYTKRALLSGVLTTTTMFWLSDESDGCEDSRAFLDRRIDNVLSIGKIVGRLKTA